MVGASDFVLDENHQLVLFGYVEQVYVHALQITLDTREITKNEDTTIAITDEDDAPVQDATIHVGDHDYRTDQDGTATIIISDPGTYNIFAEKDGYIRSEQIEVQVKKAKGKAFDLFLRFLQDSFLIDFLEKMMNPFS
jgi:uncharacterized membrane protein